MLIQKTKKVKKKVENVPKVTSAKVTSSVFSGLTVGLNVIVGAVFCGVVRTCLGGSYVSETTTPRGFPGWIPEMR